MCRTSLAIGALAFLGLTASPSDERTDGAPGADSKDLWDFKSPAARTAVSKFQKVEEKANAEYQQRLSEARTTLLTDLDLAMKEATRTANLDEANRINAAQKSLAAINAAAWPTTVRQLQILFAFYGANASWVDVTPQVRDLATKGGNRSVKILPDSGVLRIADPAFGLHKSLVIVYTWNRKLNISLTASNQQATLPPQ
jgi:hypothetical protein